MLAASGFFLGAVSSPSIADDAAVAAAYGKELAALEGLNTNQFLSALPDRAYVEGIPFDVSEADFYPEVVERLELTEREQDILAEHGAVLVDTKSHTSFGHAYLHVYSSDLPVLITTDSILQALHKSYDTLLMEIESQFFAPTIDAVLASAHTALADRLAGVAELSAPAAYADLYITVARNLLREHQRTTRVRNPKTWSIETQTAEGLLVRSVTGLDDEVSAIIEQQQSLRMMPTALFGEVRRVDFSQFKPRGHYTKSPVLKDYFRTMMWLGRADTGFGLARDDQLRAAVLLSQLLRDTGGDQQLRELDHVIDFMVGRSDNLGPDQLMAAVKATGADQSTLGGKELANLRTRLASDGGGQQKIVSQYLKSDVRTSTVAEPPALFQLFGQRFLIDSFVMNQLVFDKILNGGVKAQRFMPSGLDVFAALGNDEAARWLAPELERYRYGDNLEAARRLAAGLSESFWSGSLYNLWLDILRTLSTDLTRDDSVPAVFRSRAWQRKQTQTQLASWSQLRHDTILYAKQSFTAGVACFYPYGYVEPYPAFYGRVVDFAQHANELFQAATFAAKDVAKQKQQIWLKQRLAQFFGRMAALVGRLETLAEKQLAGEPFTQEEIVFLRRTIDWRGSYGGSGGPTWSGWYLELFYGRGGTDYDPTVSDVHTDPNQGQVLETAVGPVNFLVLAIEDPENPPAPKDSWLEMLAEGEASVYVGPVFSYYEFTKPMGQRMTDEEWMKQIATDQLPQRPAWIAPILGDRQQRLDPLRPSSRRWIGERIVGQ